MKKQAHLCTSIQRQPGSPLNYKGPHAQVVVKIDYDAVQDRRIYFDSYSGIDKVERREQTLIAIYDLEGIPIFTGTFDEMVKRLQPQSTSDKLNVIAQAIYGMNYNELLRPSRVLNGVQHYAPTDESNKVFKRFISQVKTASNEINR